MAALGAALYLLSPGRLPNAGRFSLEMLPIFFLAFRRGAPAGIFAGGILGMIILALDPYVVHPIQFLLDYPLAHMMVGISGFLRKRIWLGILAGGGGKFLCHFLAGIFFFAAFAPQGTPVWLYSAIYNGSYILPQMLIALILLPMILKRLKSS